MDNSDAMRRLMEQVMPNIIDLPGYVTDPIDMVVPDSLIAQGHLIRKFSRNIKAVLSAKTMFILKNWENFFAISCLKALSSHDMYLRYVMFACDTEIRFSDNAFDRFLSACALVMTFNAQTFQNTGVNFCELSVDIFMVFYESNLKESFAKNGGIKKLVKYLQHHEYLAWESIFIDDIRFSFACRTSLMEDMNKKLEEDCRKRAYDPSFIRHSDIITDTICESLAKKVLLTTKVNLCNLPSIDKLKIKMFATRQEKSKEKAKIRALALKKEETKVGAKSGAASAARSQNAEERAARSENAEASAVKSKNAEESAARSKNAEESAAKSKNAEERAAKSKNETSSEASKMANNIGSKNATVSAAVISEVAIAVDTKNESVNAAAKNEAMAAVLLGCYNSDTDLQANRDIEQMSIKWCDYIVEAVVKYNSKNSGLSNSNNIILKKADEILEHLKGTIKSLNEFLENYNEE